MRRVALIVAVIAAAGALASRGAPSSFGSSIQRADESAWVGGQPSSNDLAVLCGVGVRTVIDLREGVEHDVDVERGETNYLGMTFVHIPVRADAPRDRDADAFLAATARIEAFPIFVHCASGNRAAAFWMIRRLVVDGWPAEAAEAEARRVGLRSAALRDFAVEYASRRLTGPAGGPEEDEP